jgi:protein-disulfide isomerase-like protein with CxxC motif
MKDKTKQDFLKARSLGVQSFPTLLLQSQHGTHKVAAGYAKAENILSKIEEQLY